LAFDKEDLKELKKCKPGDCLIQMPASSIEQVKNPSTGPRRMPACRQTSFFNKTL